MNESLNSTIGSKNPETRFYGGSESNDFWVACAGGQKKCWLHLHWENISNKKS